MSTPPRDGIEELADQVRQWIENGEVRSWSEVADRVGMSRQLAHYSFALRRGIQIPTTRTKFMTRAQWDAVAEELQRAIDDGQVASWHEVAEALGVTGETVRQRLRLQRGMKLPHELK